MIILSIIIPSLFNILYEVKYSSVLLLCSEEMRIGLEKIKKVEEVVLL